MQGLNLMDFCKSFNDKTKDWVDSTPVCVQNPRPWLGRSCSLILSLHPSVQLWLRIAPHGQVPVVITAYSDRTFDYFIKTPPSSFFLKRAAGTPLERDTGIVSV